MWNVVMSKCLFGTYPAPIEIITFNYFNRIFSIPAIFSYFRIHQILFVLLIHLASEYAFQASICIDRCIQIFQQIRVSISVINGRCWLLGKSRNILLQATRRMSFLAIETKHISKLCTDFNVNHFWPSKWWLLLD